MSIEQIFLSQKKFIGTGQPRGLDFRRKNLQKLKTLLKQFEPRFFKAIYTDFGKSEFDTRLTEFSIIYQEINVALENLDSWGKRRQVTTDISNFPADSYIYAEAFGVCLIIGAWNYPYQLSLVPMISAIAAGNTVILKPSELTWESAKVMQEMLNSNFPKDYLHVINGGPEISQQLLELPFDKIFFTGSTAVGKLVAAAAAKNLTPVTLELGGKSPCIVLRDADIQASAKRIVWGKFINAGQTCVAPDFILVHESIKDKLLESIKTHIQSVVGSDPMRSESYSRIVNDRHFQRLVGLINPKNVFCGGGHRQEEKYIEPTVLTGIDFSHPCMQEEIFGPILPVLGFVSEDEAIAKLKSLPKPLALYVFSKNEKLAERFFQEISFGGGALNDVLMHLANHHLPFGGVGASGMGCYHGRFGFQTFSHQKSIIKKGFNLDIPIRYQPYSSWKKKLLSFLE